MYKLKFMTPGFLIYNEANEFIVQCHCAENAELVKRLLNYDLIFKKPYYPVNKFSKKAKFSIEELVDNNKI